MRVGAGVMIAMPTNLWLLLGVLSEGCTNDWVGCYGRMRFFLFRLVSREHASSEKNLVCMEY